MFIAILTFSVIILFILVVILFTKQSKFGSLPKEETIRLSSNYKDGKFQNQSLTPDLTEGASYISVLKEFLLEKKVRQKPSQPLPNKKTNLFDLLPDENVLVWMGHSSYFMQIDGKKILVDPVLSGAASPISFTTRSFAGTDVYTTNEIPEIDFLFISHDHWDHLDHSTIKKLQPKIKSIFTGLGTGQHFERWGFNKAIINERDWSETIIPEEGFKITFLPARHFSGRGFTRNKALWVSFALQTPNKKIYIGGDSGYDTHFQIIGNEYGPFDLAILECGQYDKSWKYIHMMPEEVVQSAKDLNAKKLLAVHWGKFSLANHTWDDPIKRVSKAARKESFPLLTPMIGEKVNLVDRAQIFSNWWETIE